jgi:hypothetical protein
MAATNRPANSARARALPPADDDEDAIEGTATNGHGPAILRLSGKAPRPGRRVVLFYIGEGKDQVKGSIPEVIPADVALEWLHRIATEPYAGAVDWAFLTLLGEKAYAALRGCADLTSEGLKQVTDKILAALAEARDPKAQS